MAGRDVWAKEFADKREKQIARAEELADIEHDRLAALPTRDGPIVADQVYQGTTITQKAAEGDPGARLQALGSSMTEPNPETGEYETTTADAGVPLGTPPDSTGVFEEGHEPGSGDDDAGLGDPGKATEAPEPGEGGVDETLEALEQAERSAEEKVEEAVG